MLVQYPNTYGELFDYKSVSDAIHAAGGLFITDADLLALTVVKAPGEINADVCVGSCQRFGLPMGFGGPAAGYMAVQNKHLRKMPGRIIGVTIDNHGNKCLRLALQAREQHIKRQRATSNVCTAQVLTANMSCMYAMYHGPEGLKKIATRVHQDGQRLRAVAEGERLQREERRLLRHHHRGRAQRRRVLEGGPQEGHPAAQGERQGRVRLLRRDDLRRRPGAPAVLLRHQGRRQGPGRALLRATCPPPSSARATSCRRASSTRTTASTR